MSVHNFCCPRKSCIGKPISYPAAVAILELRYAGAPKRISQSIVVRKYQPPGRRNFELQHPPSFRPTESAETLMRNPDLTILEFFRFAHPTVRSLVGKDRFQLKLWPFANAILDSPSLFIGAIPVFIGQNS